MFTRLSFVAVVLAVGLVPQDALAQRVADASVAPGGFAAVPAEDTLRPRRKAVEVSDSYELRLRVHRYTAYAIVPLFAYQYYVGQRLYDGVNGTGGDPDVRPQHQAGAALIATAFGINTVTGAWNLWETRSQSEGRTLRYLHAATMFAALGGFTYAGVKLADEAEHSADKRDQHRTVALGSMGLTLLSGTIMYFGNR